MSPDVRNSPMERLSVLIKDAPLALLVVKYLYFHRSNTTPTSDGNSRVGTANELGDGDAKSR